MPAESVSLDCISNLDILDVTYYWNTKADRKEAWSYFTQLFSTKSSSLKYITR